MTELSGPLTEFLAQAVPQEARKIHNSYELVPAEDYEQEMWAKALERRDRFEDVIRQGAYGVAREWLRQAGWKLRAEDDRYRRAQKAASAGYEKHDEEFYSVKVLRALIPMWLDNGVTEEPPASNESKGGKSGKSNASPDYLAMMLDLDYAMSQIKGYHRSILKRYFAYPQKKGSLDPDKYAYTHAEIAGALGIQARPLEGRVYRALRAVQYQLGGRNPWNRRALEYDHNAA